MTLEKKSILREHARASKKRQHSYQISLSLLYIHSWREREYALFNEKKGYSLGKYHILEGGASPQEVLAQRAFPLLRKKGPC